MEFQNSVQLPNVLPLQHAEDYFPSLYILHCTAHNFASEMPY
jgi:hypothetical protein